MEVCRALETDEQISEKQHMMISMMVGPLFTIFWKLKLSSFFYPVFSMLKIISPNQSKPFNLPLPVGVCHFLYSESSVSMKDMCNDRKTFG